MTTLEIRINEKQRTRKEAFERIKAAERGEAVGERHILNIENALEFSDIFSGRSVELLQAISEEEPKSMRKTAHAVSRDVNSVIDELHDLEHLGIVKFEANGPGKKPVCIYDEISIEINL